MQSDRNPRYDDDGDYMFDPLGIIEDLPEGKLASTHTFGLRVRSYASATAAPCRSGWPS